MQPERDPADAHRETMLTVMLCSMVVAGFLVFLVAFMGVGGLIALAAVAVVIGFGFLHYVIWGRSLTSEVEPEKEKEQQPEEDQWWTNGSQHQRFY